MRGTKITACALILVAAGMAIAVDRDVQDASTTRGGGRYRMTGLLGPEPTAASQPPRAAIRGCASRIGGDARPPEGDTIAGPLRFNMSSYSPRREWRRLARSGQWLKSIAEVRAGRQVTLVVPTDQRAWMRLRYAHRENGVTAVTLRACRHRASRAAQRRECVWAEGVVGSPGSIRDDYTACRSGPTLFSGGFEIDYARAPDQGRCAQLIVWVKGEREPLRVPLLRTGAGECAGNPA
jgi:hypothetical protein